MQSRPATAPASLCLLLALVSLAQGRAEQRLFNRIDRPVERPVAVPPPIVQFLSRDQHIAEILESQSLLPEQLPPAWFRASEVHLAGPGERDILIIGAGPVPGANVTTFWIFRPTGTGYEPLLNGAPALALEIMKRRTNGYRDIKLSSATAMEVSTTGVPISGRRVPAFRGRHAPYPLNGER